MLVVVRKYIKFELKGAKCKNFSGKHEILIV